MPKLEPYKRELPYSYVLGAFPSLHLLAAQPGHVARLLLHPEGLRNEGVEKLRRGCAEIGVREEFADKILRRESKKDNCYAALVVEKYAPTLAAGRSHVVLNGITDGGNLGTALRACLGFGYRDVALIRPCVDAWHPHVLRASMGAFFDMRVREYEDFETYRREFPDHALYPFMLTGATSLSEAAVGAPKLKSLVFGCEQSGLPEEFSRLGRPVKIEQSGEIDSLNLAVAVAIGAYAFRALDGDQ